jgi:hypothetical protein
MTHQSNEIEQQLAELRQRRDDAAAIGDHAEALILNDRIRDLKEGRRSVMVERVMRQFESGLARRRRPSSTH